jgi:hypothetical protein
MARETTTSSEGGTRDQTLLQLCHGLDPPNGAAGANTAAWPLPQQQQRVAGGVRAYGKLMARLTVTRRKQCSKVNEHGGAGDGGQIQRQQAGPNTIKSILDVRLQVLNAIFEET